MCLIGGGVKVDYELSPMSAVILDLHMYRFLFPFTVCVLTVVPGWTTSETLRGKPGHEMRLSVGISWIEHG